MNLKLIEGKEKGGIKRKNISNTERAFGKNKYNCKILDYQDNGKRKFELIDLNIKKLDRKQTKKSLKVMIFLSEIFKIRNIFVL